MMLNGTYPSPTLPAIPAVLLEAFLAERAIDTDQAEPIGDVEEQRIYATYEGARHRALHCCGLASHAQQAAALLVAIEELDLLLDGGLTIGGARELRRKLDAEEMARLTLVRGTMERLLEWHFNNGAGALLPIASWLGLAPEPVVEPAA